MASAGQQLRIAIALVALRHKPPGQSVQAYILDLQAAFPTPRPDGQLPRPPSPKPNPWRDRVLALEKELQELQAHYDGEKLELLALRKAQATGTDLTDPAPTPTQAPAGKKAKAKKTATKPSASAVVEAAPQPQAKFALAAVLQAGALADLPTAPTVSPAIEAFERLADLLAAHTHAKSKSKTKGGLHKPAVDVDLIRTTAVRALRALGNGLEGVRSPHTGASDGSASSSFATSASSWSGAGSGSSNDPARATAALTASLHRVLSTIFPALLAHLARSHSTAHPRPKKKSGKTKTSATATDVQAALDDVLGGLYVHVLRPAVCAFAPLSVGFFSTSLEPDRASTKTKVKGKSKGKGKENTNSGALLLPTDLRPAVLALLDDTLCALEDVLAGSPGTLSDPAAILGVGHVKTLLALECVRELERLYLDVDAVNLAAQAHDADITGSSPDALGVDPRSGSGKKEAIRAHGKSDGNGKPYGDTVGHRGANVPDPKRPTADDHLRARCATLTLPKSLLHTLQVPPGLAHAMGLGIGELSAPPVNSGRPAGNFGKTVSGPHDDCVRRAAAAHAPDSPSAAPPSSFFSCWDLRSGLDVGLGSGLGSGEKLVPDDEDPRRAGYCRTRTLALARKDAAWYLCAALHRLLPVGSGEAASTTAPPRAAPAPHAGSASALSSPPSGSTCAQPNDSSGSTSAGLAAEQAVYDALASLLRRTTQAPSCSTAPCSAQPSRKRKREDDTEQGACSASTSLGSSSASSSASISSSTSTSDDASAKRARVGEVDSEGMDVDVDVDVGVAGDTARDARASPWSRPRIRRTGSGTQMGEVERGMLLAVLERAWLGL